MVLWVCIVRLSFALGQALESKQIEPSRFVLADYEMAPRDAKRHRGLIVTGDPEVCGAELLAGKLNFSSRNGVRQP